MQASVYNHKSQCFTYPLLLERNLKNTNMDLEIIWRHGHAMYTALPSSYQLPESSQSFSKPESCFLSNNKPWKNTHRSPVPWRLRTLQWWPSNRTYTLKNLLVLFKSSTQGWDRELRRASPKETQQNFKTTSDFAQPGALSNGTACDSKIKTLHLFLLPVKTECHLPPSSPGQNKARVVKGGKRWDKNYTMTRIKLQTTNIKIALLMGSDKRMILSSVFQTQKT